MRRSSGSLEGPDHAKSVGTASADRRAVTAGPRVGVSTSRKGRVGGGATGGRPQGEAAPAAPRIARDATAPPARAADPQGSTDARLARGSGWGRRRRLDDRDVSNGGVAGPRVAPSSPAGGTRGIGRTRGRFRVRSRSIGGGFEFKAARRPSTPAGAPAKAGATVDGRRCIPVRPASIEASGSLLSRPDNGPRSQDRP